MLESSWRSVIPESSAAESTTAPAGLHVLQRPACTESTMNRRARSNSSSPQCTQEAESTSSGSMRKVAVFILQEVRSGAVRHKKVWKLTVRPSGKFVRTLRDVQRSDKLSRG